MAAAKKRQLPAPAEAPQLPGMEVAQVRAALDGTTDPREAELIRAKAAGLHAALKSPAAADIVGCDDPGEVRRRLRDMAEAILWAKRRLGELMPAVGAGRRTDLSSLERSETLAVADLNPGELARCRDLASIPIAAFESVMEQARAAGREPSQTALLKLAPPKPPKEPRPGAAPPALARAAAIVRQAASSIRRLVEAPRGQAPPDGAHEVLFVAGLLEQLAAKPVKGEPLSLLADLRSPLERVQALLGVVASHVESEVLSKIDEDDEAREHEAVANAVRDLRERAVDVEIAAGGPIQETARAYRMPIPRDR